MTQLIKESTIFSSHVTFAGDTTGLFGFRNVFDITSRSFKARPGTSYNSGPAIRNAIDAALQQSQGGVVYIPGAFRSDEDIIIPPVTDRSIILKGDGVRGGSIYPTTPGGNGIVVGSSTPDPSGTSTKLTQYCGLENISVNGSLIASGDSVGVYFGEAQRCWYKGGIIEAYTKGASKGLYLRGSTTVGVGNPAAPHCWNCYFELLTIATSMRPMVLENVDECTFNAIVAGLPVGLVGAANANICLEIIQGHSNQWNRLTLSGDRSNVNAYAGVKFNQPTKGDNTMNVINGLVAEGFNDPIIFGGNLAIACGVRDHDASICNTIFHDLAPQVGSRCFVYAPLHHVDYKNDAPQYTDFLTLSGSTPNVSGAQCIFLSNGGATNVTNLLGGHNGDIKLLVLDANTTIVNGGAIATISGGNYSGSGKMLIATFFGGSTWKIGALA